MFKYDFALSFAGEHREIAERLAKLLQLEKVRVFYDKDEQADLWGQDLYQKFQQIYGQGSRFFIPFVSREYLAKKWPKHELRQAQAREFKSDIEYILPLRLDDTELPGLNDTTAYFDLRNTSIEDVADLCLKKLARDSSIRQLFLYLREKNPAAIEALEAKRRQILIRVATSNAQSLERLLPLVRRKMGSTTQATRSITTASIWDLAKPVSMLHAERCASGNITALTGSSSTCQTKIPSPTKRSVYSHAPWGSGF